MRRIKLSSTAKWVRRMNWPASVLALSFLVAAFAAAQSTIGAPPMPSFEAATIRPAQNADPAHGYWSLPGIGRFYAHSVSVQTLIQLAYGVESSQISAKPKWLGSQFYDVEAKPQEGIKLSRDELKPRLQNLLAERFHLAAHFKSRMVRGYALVVAKGGPHLTPTKADHFPGYRIHVGTGELRGLNWSIPQLAIYLTPAVGLPVVDQTGIAGSYDINVTFAPDLESDSSLPSLFTVLRETLGLQLKPKQVPVAVLVIDHIDEARSAD